MARRLLKNVCTLVLNTTFRNLIYLFFFFFFFLLFFFSSQPVLKLPAHWAHWLRLAISEGRNSRSCCAWCPKKVSFRNVWEIVRWWTVSTITHHPQRHTDSSGMLKDTLILASSCCQYVQEPWLSRDVQVLQYLYVIWTVVPTFVKLRE